MVSLVVIFAVIAVAVGQGFEDENLVYGNGRAFESQINKTLECVRGIIINGDEKLQIPPLDPINIKALSVDLDELNLPGISGTVSLRNFDAKGSAGWLVTYLKSKVTIFPIGAKIETVIGWPASEVSGEYDIDLSILGEHVLRGSGKFSGSAKNFVLAIQAHAVLNKLGLKKLSVQPALESINLSIDNLELNGKDISKELSETVSSLDKFVEENVKELDAVISTTVMEIVNNNDFSAALKFIMKRCL